jgi:hypothetical protein
MGDANGDGEINVSDIVEIVNYIMGKPSAKFVKIAADLNGDNEVNVTDIVKVVSIIMSANGNQSRMSEEQTEMTDNDWLQLTCKDSQTMALSLVNEGGYVASQFDLVLSADQSLENILLNSSRKGNHLMGYTKTGNNRYRVVIYSMDNSIFNGHHGELLTINVSGSGDVCVENILFVTTGQLEKRFSPLYGETTGINVSTTQTEPMDVYGIDGRQVRKQVKTLNGLEKGMYIINGKKLIVR